MATAIVRLADLICCASAGGWKRSASLCSEAAAGLPFRTQAHAACRRLQRQLERQLQRVERVASDSGWDAALVPVGAPGLALGLDAVAAKIELLRAHKVRVCVCV